LYANDDDTGEKFPIQIKTHKLSKVNKGLILNLLNIYAYSRFDAIDINNDIEVTITESIRGKIMSGKSTPFEIPIEQVIYTYKIHIRPFEAVANASYKNLPWSKRWEITNYQGKKTQYAKGSVVDMKLNIKNTPSTIRSQIESTLFLKQKTIQSITFIKDDELYELKRKVTLPVPVVPIAIRIKGT
jgi:uncharacterized protein affecting Mg2+/Co2+ transport